MKQYPFASASQVRCKSVVTRVVGLFLTRHNEISNDDLLDYGDMGRNETV